MIRSTVSLVRMSSVPGVVFSVWFFRNKSFSCETALVLCTPCSFVFVSISLLQSCDQKQAVVRSKSSLHFIIIFIMHWEACFRSDSTSELQGKRERATVKLCSP